jgi:hypothetical protein
MIAVKIPDSHHNITCTCAQIQYNSITSAMHNSHSNPVGSNEHPPIVGPGCSLYHCVRKYCSAVQVHYLQSLTRDRSWTKRKIFVSASCFVQSLRPKSFAPISNIHILDLSKGFSGGPFSKYHNSSTAASYETPIAMPDKQFSRIH